MEDERKSGRMRRMERLHTQGGEAEGEHQKGGGMFWWVVEETNKVPVHRPIKNSHIWLTKLHVCSTNVVIFQLILVKS